MKSNQVILYTSILNDKLQGLLIEARRYLIPRFTLAGKQEAKRATEIDEAQLDAVCRIPIAKYIQAKLFEIIKLYPVGVAALRSKDEKDNNLKRIDEITSEIHDVERQTNPLEERNKLIRPDRQKQKLRRSIPKVAATIAIADGFLVAAGFLPIFGILFSIITAAAISSILYLLPHPAKAFIMKPANLRHQALRFLLVALIAMVVFYCLASFRAAAYNSQTSISLISSARTIVSPLIICALSCFLFLGLVIVYLYLHRTQERETLDKEYEANCDELERLKTRQAALIDEQKAITAQTIYSRDISRMLHHESELGIKQLIAIGAEAYGAFTEAYALQRGNTPTCFSNEFNPNYDTTDPFSKN